MININVININKKYLKWPVFSFVWSFAKLNNCKKVKLLEFSFSIFGGMNIILRRDNEKELKYENLDIYDTFRQHPKYEYYTKGL